MENKIYTDKNKVTYITFSKSGYTVKSEKISDDDYTNAATEYARKRGKLYTKFDELCDYIELTRITKLTGSYQLYALSTMLVCFSVSGSLAKRDLVFIYKYESKEFADMCDKIFINGSKVNDVESNIIYVNANNNYQFGANSCILRLVFTAASLKANKIPLVTEFKIPKKDGKMREIVAPARDLIPVLGSINKILQKTYDKRNESFQVAYKCGKSIVDNARPHATMKYEFKLDLHNFFPSCKKERVEKYVRFLFKNSINTDYLKEHFFECILKNDALYIGNPCSGTIANAILSTPVKYISAMCKKFDMNFTVYADDMTFSSNKFISKEFVVGMFNTAFTKYNMESDFSLNEKKSHGCSGTNRSATGVAFNNENKMTCHRYMYNGIRQTLHQLSYGDESHYNYHKLQGQMAFAMMVDESGKMKKLISKYKDVIEKYHLMSDKQLENVK